MSGGPARRAVFRWAVRMFRREWRQQLITIAMLALAVGMIVFAAPTIINSGPTADTLGTLGTANTLVHLPGNDKRLTADLAGLRAQVGPVAVIGHQDLRSGSTDPLELRAQDPAAPFGAPTLALDSGRYPHGANEIAVTTGTQTLFDLHQGSDWPIAGRTFRVVGIVENPNNLQDNFALVAPSQLPAPSEISLLFNGEPGHFTPPADATSVLNYSPQPDFRAEVIVLAMGVLGLMFVGLLASAGFAVLAQRRLRAIGMLGALGATEGHIRLVMLANGAIVGVVAATAGGLAGFLAWLGYAPVVEELGEHRVDRLALPWWLLAAALLLAVLTSIVAAWWPARSAARVPVVTALANRPSEPAPARRFAVAGAGLIVIGLVGLAFVRDLQSRSLAVGGLVLTIIGSLFLAPLLIAALGRIGARTPVASRIAFRDLARYRARSSAALAAISIAVAIAAAISVELTGRTLNVLDDVGPSLADNELAYYTMASGAHDPGQRDAVTELAATLHATSVLPLTKPKDIALQTIDANKVTDSTGQIDALTPDILRRYGIDPNSISADADLVTSRAGLAELPDLVLSDRQRSIAHPVIQTISALPGLKNEPSLLITPHAMRTLGITAEADGWLITTPQPLTSDEINLARQLGLRHDSAIQTTASAPSMTVLGNWATGVGIALALGVLAMMIGMIRRETLADRRTLTAVGASPGTRRRLAGLTAGSLAFLGALTGTAVAYAGLLSYYRSELDTFGHPPVLALLAILVGLPAMATVGGWLFAGREPDAIARAALT
ncbi:MAG TPA: FtsX-like permease family protein [Pseudonocardiaceae bacterium]|nr:FtsX-like permease family protein [Pseudonocardiaceae bacterium]